jgi:hypothetical protein
MSLAGAAVFPAAETMLPGYASHGTFDLRDFFGKVRGGL